MIYIYVHFYGSARSNSSFYIPLYVIISKLRIARYVKQRDEKSRRLYSRLLRAERMVTRVRVPVLTVCTFFFLFFFFVLHGRGVTRKRLHINESLS